MTTGIFQIEGDFHKEVSDEDDFEIADDVRIFINFYFILSHGYSLFIPL